MDAKQNTTGYSQVDDTQLKFEQFCKDNKVAAVQIGAKLNIGTCEFVVQSFGSEMLVLRALPGTTILGAKDAARAYGRGGLL